MVNVYREDVVVVTTLGDPKFKKITITKDTKYEIKTQIPVSMQSDPRVSFVAFHNFSPLKIDGFTSKSFYLSRSPTKVPYVFYIEKRKILCISTELQTRVVGFPGIH